MYWGPTVLEGVVSTNLGFRDESGRAQMMFSVANPLQPDQARTARRRGKVTPNVPASRAGTRRHLKKPRSISKCKASECTLRPLNCCIPPTCRLGTDVRAVVKPQQAPGTGRRNKKPTEANARSSSTA